MSGSALMTENPADAPGGERLGWLGNAGWLVAGRLMVAVLGWSGTIIVARNLDQDGFGRFTFIFGLLGMLAIVTDLGLGRIALTGVMPEADDPRAFAGTYVVLRLLLGLLGYVIAVGFTLLGGYPSEVVVATAVGGLVVIVATASHAYELVLQAHLRLGVVAVSAVVGRLAQLGLIAAIVVADGGLVLLMIPAVIAELVIAAIKIPWSVLIQPATYAINPRLWWSLLREAVPISVGAALATLYFRVDSIMLSKLSDFTAVGIYGVAFKFVDVLHFVALSVSIPLLTVLVRSWPGRLQDFKQAVDRTVGLFTFLAGALIVHFGFFAEETVRLLYGTDYTSGARAVQLLILGEIVALGSVIGLTLLTAAGRHRHYPYVALLGLVINVCLNILAINRYGFEGAAATTVVTEVVVVIGMWWLVSRVDKLPLVDRRPFLFCLPAILIAALSAVLLETILPWWFAAVAAGFVYVTAWLVVLVMAMVIDRGRNPVVHHPKGVGQVLVVGHSRSGSGAERVLLRYVDAMSDAGFVVRGACPEGYVADALRADGRQPLIIPDLQLPGGPRPVAAVIMVVRWLRAAAVIYRSTSNETILVVNGLLALPAVRLSGRGRQSLWLVHDVVVRSDLRLVAKLSATGLAGAVGVSEAAAAFPRSIGVPTTVIRNGTNWPVAPGRLDISGRPVIGINAMVTSWKGHHVLFEAVASLPGVDLEVLGGRFPKDQDYVEQLQNRAAASDLAGRVRFLGHRDEPMEVMRTWAIAVSASVEPEAGPLAVLEAMSLGIPVVATAHGGAVEVVGDAGLLVEPGDAAAMTAALGRLVADHALRTRCSVAGRKAVAGGLTEAASNRAFVEQISSLLAERSKR